MWPRNRLKMTGGWSIDRQQQRAYVEATTMHMLNKKRAYYVETTKVQMLRQRSIYYQLN